MIKNQPVPKHKYKRGQILVLTSDYKDKFLPAAVALIGEKCEVIKMAMENQNLLGQITPPPRLWYMVKFANGQKFNFIEQALTDDLEYKRPQPMELIFDQTQGVTVP